jgi:hypothetical protein
MGTSLPIAGQPGHAVLGMRTRARWQPGGRWALGQGTAVATVRADTIDYPRAQSGRNDHLDLEPDGDHTAAAAPPASCAEPNLPASGAQHWPTGVFGREFDIEHHPTFKQTSLG